jgi:hypothetical protein
MTHGLSVERVEACGVIGLFLLKSLRQDTTCKVQVWMQIRY